MKVIGLTGQFSSGKSTICKMLRGRGIKVVDLDAVAQKMLKEEAILSNIKHIFGERCFDENGVLVLNKLYSLMGSEPINRERLNAIKRERLLDMIKFAIDKFSTRTDILVIKSYLFLDGGANQFIDGLISVSSYTKERIERLMKTDGLTQEEASVHIMAHPGEITRHTITKPITTIYGDNFGDHVLEASLQNAWLVMTEQKIKFSTPKTFLALVGDTTSRCLAFFNSPREAKLALMQQQHHTHSPLFDWAVIEEYCDGFDPPVLSEEWFRFDSEKVCWYPSNKPQFADMSGWAMGL